MVGLRTPSLVVLGIVAWLGALLAVDRAVPLAGQLALGGATPEAQQGSQAVRAVLGQAAPLLTALVGIFVWRELKGADMRVRSLTLLMIVLYGCGVVLLSIAPMYLRHA